MSSLYRKKPVTVEARQLTADNGRDLANWCAGSYSAQCQMLHIQTLEGVIPYPLGYWVIKGVEGEFYACRADIFEQTYEPAS